jgi:hypothetical protein
MENPLYYRYQKEIVLWSVQKLIRLYPTKKPRLNHNGKGCQELPLGALSA